MRGEGRRKGVEGKNRGRGMRERGSSPVKGRKREWVK